MSHSKQSARICEATQDASFHKPSTLLALFLLISLLSTLFISSPVAAGEAPAITIDSYKRTVEIQQKNGSWRPYDGEQLNLPFAIRTGKKSRVALSQGDTKIKINSNSELHLASAAPSPSSRAAGFIALIKQKLGAAIYKVEKHPGEFRVETPHLVSVVKGTRFSVTSNNEKSFVSVTEGLVEVTDSSSNTSTLARPGDIISSDENSLSNARQPIRVQKALGMEILAADAKHIRLHRQQDDIDAQIGLTNLKDKETSQANTLSNATNAILEPPMIDLSSVEAPTGDSGFDALGIESEAEIATVGENSSSQPESLAESEAAEALALVLDMDDDSASYVISEPDDDDDNDDDEYDDDDDVYYVFYRGTWYRITVD